MHRWALRVRYADTDRMGFAYYAHYLRWFEIGRTELLRAAGSSYRELEERTGIALPVVEAHCRYVKPARYDDALVVATGVLDLKRASVRFGYRVSREVVGGEELLAFGTTAHCFLTRDGRPGRPPDSLMALLAAAPATCEEDLARVG